MKSMPVLLKIVNFILPEGIDFSKLKNCDIIDSGRLSKPVLSDSISQVWALEWYIENIWNALTCQKSEI
jgi:hypothetical protein